MQEQADEPPQEREKRVRNINNLYAFQLFCQHRFEESLQLFGKLGTGILLLLLLLRSSIGGVVYVTIFNSSAIWAATFRLRGYKCMLVIFVFPSSTKV